MAVLTAGLVRLGLLQGEVAALIEQVPTGRFICTAPATGWAWMYTMWAITKQNGDWRRFEAGMVLTVEPGLYVGKDETSVAKSGAASAFVLRMMYWSRLKVARC